MQDESLQSYVFRTILLNGENDFSSVISKDGSWNLLVNISSSHVSYFQKKSENRLVYLIKRNYERHIRLSFHHNPFYYLELYKFFFGICSRDLQTNGFSGLKRKGKNISFCTNCLTDDIRSNGFAYFRARWDTTTFCDTHKSSLYYLPQSTRTKRVEEIRLILKGEEPATARRYPIKSDPREQKTFTGSLDKDYFHLPVSPCLLKIVSHKLRRVVSDYYNSPEKDYDDMIDRVMYSMYNGFLYKSGVYKQVNAYKTDQFLKTLIRKKYSPIETYLTDLYEEVVAVNGIDGSESCSERMLAPKSRDCHKCEYPKTTCALSPKIVSFVQSRHMRVAHGNNYCDRVIKNSAQRYPQKIHFSTSNINEFGDFGDYFFEIRQYQYDLIDLLS